MTAGSLPLLRPASDDPYAAARALARQHGLCESHREVYLAFYALWCAARAGGDVSPQVITSYRELARMADVSYSAAYRAIAKAAAKGLVLIDDRSQPDRLFLHVPPHAFRPDPQQTLPFKEEETDGLVSTADHDRLPDGAEVVPAAEPCRAAFAFTQTQTRTQTETPRRTVDGASAAGTPGVEGGCETTLTAGPRLARDSLNDKEPNDKEREPVSSQYSRKGPESRGASLVLVRREKTKNRDSPASTGCAQPLGDALIPAINRLCTRSARGRQEAKAELVRRMQTHVRDPTTEESLYRRVADAVLEDRLDEAELDDLLEYVAQQRREGNIRKSAGGLFNRLVMRRLGPDLKGGAK